MRTQTITPIGAKITATYPRELKKLEHSINSGINRIRRNAKQEENLHYKISQNKDGNIMIAVRERGLSNWFNSLSGKNKIQLPISKEEFEHGIIGNEFTPTFMELHKTFKFVKEVLPKIKQHPYNEALDYLS